MNQKEETNQKILELMNQDDSLSEEEVQLFKSLIFKCDLTVQNKNNLTPLMYTLLFNKTKNLDLTKEQWNYLLEHSNLTKQDNNGWTPLMYAFTYNQEKNLHFTKEQFDYLIKNSDLRQQNNFDWTPLLFALEYNQKQNSQLTKKQFQILYETLTKEQQQTTFKFFIDIYIYKSNEYKEEMNLLLYDLQFQPSIETIEWLKNCRLKSIIKMIEKRDVFFQLHQEIKFVENKKNSTKI
jgi:ankyrin repeat protein